MLLDRNDYRNMFERSFDQIRAIDFFIKCVANDDNEDVLNSVQLMLKQVERDLASLYSAMQDEE